MANPAELILRTLDAHMVGPADIRLLGGAALVLAYGMNRTTEDADLLLDDEEFSFLVEKREFGEALELTNEELKPLDLYISHIWGPEQQILTPEWRQSCRSVAFASPMANLSVSALVPLELIASKLCRATTSIWPTSATCWSMRN